VLGNIVIDWGNDMQRKIVLFDELFRAVCEIGEKIRSQLLTDNELSITDCVENCEALSAYIHKTGQKDVDKYREAQSKVQNGEWFVSDFFHRIIVHMQLLEAIEEMDYSVEMDILEMLVVRLGNGVYYDISKLKSVMECAENLYLETLKRNRVYKPRLDEGTQLLISAVKDLKKEGIRVLIVQGEPELEQDSEELLISKLDGMIKKVGGMFVIRQLFEQEIRNRYNRQLDRYLICRNKRSSLGGKQPESRIPYQYLLQLSLKHLKGDVLLREANKKNLYNKIIRLSKDYLEVLQLQGYYVLSEILEPLEDFPYRLSRNLNFEKLCIPRQYHPKYIKMLLCNMLEPFYSQGTEKPRVYSFFNYVEMVKHILNTAKGPTIFSKNDLKAVLGISEYKLNVMLQDISMEVEQVNPDFLHFLDKTNTWQKPLIKLDEEQYFCLDGRMAGYAFYEVMYQILFTARGAVFSRRQGPVLEQMVYQMFKDKHFSYVTGKYKQIDDLPERDCDMILEGQKQVMFLEIKKCPLPNSYEQGDDVKVLQSLGDGMLYAQEQILWHKLRVKEKGVLELYDADGKRLMDYTPGNKQVMAVSICMPEYDFLTVQNITEAFLKSTLRFTYHAVDPGREDLLKKLNKRVKTIQMVAGRLFDGKPFDGKKVFFWSQFRSLQQIWIMLEFCETVDVFLDMCKHQSIILTGAEDVYVEILNALQSRNLAVPSASSPRV
jgi:hypothetical protein